MADSIEIKCSFPDESALCMAYMPFLQEGGLFVRSDKIFPLGTFINLSVYLFDEPQPYKIDAKVAWITPHHTQGNKPAGLGLQFIGKNRDFFNNKIKTCVGNMLKSSQITDTM